MSEVITALAVLTDTTPAPYFIHRSGTETLWTCPRKYYLEYLHLGTGIRKQPTKLQLTVGTCVHAGLAIMCLVAAKFPDAALSEDMMELDAIPVALEIFRSSDTYLFLKPIEQREQETLIEGILWAFFFHSWTAFLRVYEIITVERAFVERLQFPDMPEFVISSRPDCIARHRLTNQFIGVSWKTIDDLTEFKRWNFRQNLQNLMETWYGEMILADVLDNEYEFTPEITGLKGRALIAAMEKAIADFKALPREIAYVQTVFFQKGPRVCELLDGTVVPGEEWGHYTDAEKVYRQSSMLCYRYVNAGSVEAEPEPVPELTKAGKPRKVRATAVKIADAYSWSYRYYKPGNKGYNNLSGDWVRQAIWESDTTVKEWVRALSQGSVFPSTGEAVSEGGVVDPRNAVQPLTRVVVWDEPVERNAELMRVTMDELVTRHYDAVKQGSPSEGCKDPFEMSLFPRTLSACHNCAPSAGVPVRCEYIDICFEPAPLVSIEGTQWVNRIPHHEIERESFKERGLLP